MTSRAKFLTMTVPRGRATSARSSGRPKWVASFMATVSVLGFLSEGPLFAEEAVDPHAAHRAMMAHAMKRAQSAPLDVKVPEVQLVREDGKSVSLADALGDGRPVVLNFVFTTCGTICPVMSQTFARLQAELGAARDGVQMVSISIDPEYDTPARLAEYSKKFHAGPGWRFYTGTAEASVAVQRAFQAFRGDKMSHTPVTFVRLGSGPRWTRIDGFASASELADALRGALGAR